jgi:restriction endonuclease S subunit
MKWHHVEIGKVADVVSGYGFPREYQGLTDEEIPFFKVGDMNLPGNEKCMTTIANTISGATLKKLKAKAFPQGTIIFPKIGAAIATNKKRVLTQPSVVDNNVMGIIPKSQINSWYLYYWMLQFDLRNVSNIGPVPSMRKTEMERVSIPLPPLSEQRRIVEILDQADALRKKRTEADAKAARILPAIFYKMFGDPATNPKGWPIKRLGDPNVATINPRLAGNSMPANKDFSFVPMADVDEIWGRIVGKQVRPYSSVMCGFTSFQDNDVLFAKITPCMQNGKAAIARTLVGGCGFGSTEFHILRAGPEATPEWLFALVRMAWFRRQAEASLTGTVGQQRVPAGFLIRYEVPCPPVDLQHSFAKAVNRIFDWVNCSEQVRQRIDRLFSVILQRAFTGYLTAKWREAHMKELLEEMEQQINALEIRVQ